MSDRHNGDAAEGRHRGFWRSPLGLVAVAALLIGSAALFWPDRPYALGWLPWFVILACPLVHVFLHGGHGSASVARNVEARDDDDSSSHRH